MKRTILNKPKQIPDAILTSDWHLREDQPICRIDNFWEEQWNKVRFVRDLQKKYKCYVLHAGDLFHHWKPSPFLLSNAISNLPEQFFTVYGQHDLPQRNLSLADKSGIYTLSTSGSVCTGFGTNFGEEPRKEHLITIQGREILIWHKLVWTGKVPWPGCTDPTAESILDKYPMYSLILTGDNHLCFSININDRLLVNPGSLTRQTADQVDHRPRVYLWYSKTNAVEPIYLPIKEGVVSREHISHDEVRDKRIEAFVSKLNDEWESDLDFPHNLENFIKENNVDPKVVEIIRKAVDYHE